MRVLLKQLRDILDAGDDKHHYVEHIDAALAGDDTALWSFLISNELWGGAGSIADQALGASRETRRPLEQLLAELGREQIALGRTNQRTEIWTSVFDQWHAQTSNQSLQLTAGRRDDQFYFHETAPNFSNARLRER